MSLQDSLFSADVENDITLFSRDERRKRVLVFPPVNNYRRFLVHQFVQDQFADLLYTFSIGQGDARRTVVCFKTDVIRDPKLNVSTSKTSGNTKSSVMGVQGQCSTPSPPEYSVKKQRQVKTIPTVEIYRPPAARKVKSDHVDPESSTEQLVPESNASTKTGRQKRPDRAVYVPRPRRSLKVEGGSVQHEKSRSDRPRERDLVNSPAHTVKVPCNLVPVISEELNSIRQVKEKKPIDCVESNKLYQSDRPKDDFVQINSENLDGESSNSADSTFKSFELCENIENVTESQDLSRTENQSLNAEDDSSISTFDSLTFNSNIAVDSNVEENNRVCESKNNLSPIDRRKNSVIRVDNISLYASYEENYNIEMLSEQNHQKLDDDASKRDEIANQKNKRVVSPNAEHGGLIISNHGNKEDTMKQEVSVTPMIPPEKKVKKIERPKSKPAAPPSPSIKVSRDDCDWDSLFDDNGDCLDPTLIEELSSAVGEVTIEQPKNSYKSYTKTVEVSSDEFAHVVEIYNFPSEFKTCDLVAVFSPFKSGGFELKWVDDTHCLGVFSSPLVAAEVLASDHPFVKTRPLSEATALSKTKAKRSSEFLQPYRNRPETCAALARRLVTGALGVRLATARQEREREKIVLREAKEKKRLANKQRDDAWEGVITEK